ncbi:MAG: AAA family ATPase [Prevotella sp.]|nr:AAA family ATPase [Prevotella sp.]
MKLLNLKIHNLASIEDAEIDFNGSVLGDEPLFLITGATGAGKSTILDAICLALYNDTPRLSGGEDKKMKITERFNDAKAKDKNYVPGFQEITLDHKGQLLRRGAAEAWVELRFKAKDTEYLAKWYVKRRKCKADGKLESPQNSLTNLATGQVVSAKRAFDEEISKVVELSFDEFCRTTMLAQGEFTRFLQSSSKNKSVILEQLTRTTEYTEIGKKIHELTKTHEIDYRGKEALLQGITVFSEEQTAEKIREKDGLKTLSETLSADLAECERKRKWLSDDSQFASEIEKRTESLQGMMETTQTDEYKRKGKMVADYDATTEPRAWMADMEQARLQIQLLKDEEPGMAGQFAELVAANDMVGQALDDDSRELEKVEAWIGERQDHAGMLHDAKAITLRLKQVQADEESIRDKQQMVEEKNNRFPEMDERIGENRKNEQEVAAQLLQKSQERDEITRKRDAFDRNGLVEKSKTLSDKRDDIKKAISGVILLDTKRVHLEQQETAYKNLMDEERRLEDELPGLKKQVELQKELHEREKKAYDNIRSSMEENIKALRATLKKGMKCPLCLQEVEQDHVPDLDYDTCIRPLLEAEKKSWDAMEKAMAELKAGEKTLMTLGKQVAEAKKTWEKASGQFDNQTEMLRKDLMKVLGSEPDMAMPSTQMQEMLGLLVEQVEKELDEVNERLEELAKIGSQLEQMMREEKKLLKKQAEAKAATLEAENKKKQLQADIDAANRDRRQLQDGINEAMELLRSDISWAGWEKEWENDHNAFIKRLNDEASDLDKAEKRRTSLNQVIATRKMTLEVVGQSKEGVETLVPKWVGVPKVEPARPQSEADLPRLWNTLANKVNTWKTSLANKEEDLAKNEERVRAFIVSHPDISMQRLVELSECVKDEVEATRRWHEEVEAAIQNEKGGLATFKQQRARHQEDKPDFREEETAEWLKDKAAELDERCKKTLQEIGQLEQQLREDKEKQKKHAQALVALEKSRGEYDQWKKLDDELGSSDGSRFCRVAQSFILRHLLAHANNYLSKFTNRYELVCEPGVLTILVKDRFSSQSPQSARILSGGESFMVSLSLALALAKLNVNQSSVDTLFIDEGFGTLDEECLNVVMDTLEQLHQMGGHRVGIISHVDALNDRIHAQVQVKRVNPSKSIIEVVRT